MLPVTYRDFDGQHLPTGHPDFFYLSATNNCVPNASGRTVGTNGTCWDSDSTPLCHGIAAAALGPDGKPVLGTKTECACRFTDWDGALAGTGMCTDSNGGAHSRTEKMVKVVQSAESFKQWYSDSALSDKKVGTLELAATAAGYQFSSSGGRDVYNDLHDIFMGTGTVTSLSSGFFPLEDSTRASSGNLCRTGPRHGRLHRGRTVQRAAAVGTARFLHRDDGRRRWPGEAASPAWTQLLLHVGSSLPLPLCGFRLARLLRRR